MGDRANFGFRQSNGDTIYLYGHWAGSQMMNRLATALETARPRWSDESYATRICISQIIGDEWDQEYSWGISTHIGDNEHSVPIVDWGQQTVSLFEHNWGKDIDETNPKFTMSLDAFVQKFVKIVW
jgi:hypothetical protein